MNKSKLQETEWLICLQTSYDCVKYHTSTNLTKYPSYHDFLQLMMEMHISDSGNFKKMIDSFKVIFIDLKTMQWEIIKQDKDKNISFEELADLNISKGEENKIESMVTRGKNFLFKPLKRKF